MYSDKKLYSGHKLHMRLAFGVALAVSLLAVSATSALASDSGGTGSFHAAAHLNPPPEVCATYSLYNVHLTFTQNKSTFTASSDPTPLNSDFQWGENGSGTYNPQTSAGPEAPCITGPGAMERGFTGTLTIPGPPSSVCTLSGGSYKRTDINVEYDFTGVTPVSGTGCPAAPLAVKANIQVLYTFNPPLIIPPGIQIDNLTACNSIIAPTSCVLTNGTY